MEKTPDNAVNWFEIPVTELDRAQKFYEAIFATRLRREAFGTDTLAVFPKGEAAVGGCLMAGPRSAMPTQNGTIVYLNAMPSLDAVLARVAEAGGRIATPRVDLPDGMGSFAHIIDTEGNRVGVHALA